MTEIAMTVEELRGDVVSGLVEQGFKRADCELVSRECLNTGSFDEFYREALDRISTRRRNGHSVVQVSFPRASPRKAAPKAAPARVAALEPRFCANPACGKKLRSSNRDLLGRCSSCRIRRWTPQIAAAASSKPAPAAAPEARRQEAAFEKVLAHTIAPDPPPDALPRGGALLAVSLDTFRAKFTRTIGTKDEWTAALLRDLMAAPLGLYEIVVPAGRSVDSLRMRLKRAFRGTASDVATFTTKADKHLLGVRKEARR